MSAAKSRIQGSVIKASKRVVDSARHGAGLAAKSAREKAVALSTLSQGALASALSVDLNSAMASLAKGPATIYDKAMDANYLASSIGGGNHRLFDGGHTLSGAFQAAHDASPDDSIAEVAFGYMQGLFRDVTTPKGLPLANWDKATYDQASAFMKAEFGIPKSWFYDLNSFDAAEVLGSSIGVLAATLMWSRADAEQFSRLAAGMGLAAALSANPLLLIVTVVCLAKAFSKARSEGRLGDVADGLARGSGTSVTTLGAVALTSMAGVAGRPGCGLGGRQADVECDRVGRRPGGGGPAAGNCQGRDRPSQDERSFRGENHYTRKFNREKLTQPASAIEIIGRWDPVNECVVPFTAKEWAERLRRRLQTVGRRR